MKVVRIVKLIVRTSKSTTYMYFKGQWTLHALHFNIFHASDTVSLRDTIILKEIKVSAIFCSCLYVLKINTNIDA